MALISIVFSLLITAIIVFAVLTIYKGGKKDEENVIGSPVERGKGVQCLTQIRRIEAAIQMYAAEHNRYPSSLDEMDYLSDKEFYCPVTGNRYKYNASTGEVTCPDHPR